MPAWLLNLYVEAIPQLKASEAMHQATVLAVGTGNLKKEAQRRITAQWEREAYRHRKRQRRGSLEQTAAALGFGIIREDKPHE